MKKTLSLFCLILFCTQLVFASNPQLSFFNEQHAEDLEKLFSDTTLIPNLKKLNAQIRMAMLDLSPERAKVLKRLNEAGIPVVAWLLLPKEKGYWFHGGNSQQAFERYDEIKEWAKKNGVQFSGIGIDLEIDINDLDLFKSNKWNLLGKVVYRLYDKSSFLEGQEEYKKLIEKIRKDGYTVESYYIPYVKHEVAKGRTSLQQASKIMDIETDKDIPMIYTSFMGEPYGSLKVLALDEKLEYLALGSAGGGFDPSLPSMTWEELAYDLRLASQVAKEIHIFCLEATVEKGYFPRLIDFDYSVPVEIYPEQVEIVHGKINKIMWVSTIFSYPTLVILSLLLIFGFILWLSYRLVRVIIKSILKLRS